MNVTYESEDFPASGPVRNGAGLLSVTWDDLLWAAITVGRPNRHYVFQHGQSSLYEALFRLSAVRMTLEQRSPGARRFHRTNAAKSLDPSEKGAVHYFLGLTMCKLFADKLLSAPWLLHLDVFRDRLNPTLLSGRSRPDLVGLTLGGDWVVMESKGRASKPTAEDRRKAKEQAKRIAKIQGTTVQWRIGGIAYFYDDVLKFHWRDPQPEKREPRNSVSLNVTPDEILKNYYRPLLDLVGPEDARHMIRNERPVHFTGGDFSINFDPHLLDLLLAEEWMRILEWRTKHPAGSESDGFHHDGVIVKAGPSWSKQLPEA